MAHVVRNVRIARRWTSSWYSDNLIAIRIAGRRVRRLARFTQTRLKYSVSAWIRRLDELAVGVAGRRIGRLAHFTQCSLNNTVTAARNITVDFTCRGAAITVDIVSIIADFTISESEDAVATYAAAYLVVDIADAICISDCRIQAFRIEDHRTYRLQRRVGGILGEITGVEVHDGFDVICTGVHVRVAEEWKDGEVATSARTRVCTNRGR
jgi:hypothetical protein